MDLAQIIQSIGLLLIGALAWYYKRDADNNASTIKSLNSGVDELKQMFRVHTTNYEHLLKEVQALALECRDNRRDITTIERDFSKKVHTIELELEKSKNMKLIDIIKNRGE